MSSCSILSARDSSGNQISLLNEDLAPKVRRRPASQEPLLTTDHLRLPLTLEPPLSPELRRRQVLLAKHPKEQDPKCKLRPFCLDDWSFHRRRKEHMLPHVKVFRLSPHFSLIEGESLKSKAVQRKAPRRYYCRFRESHHCYKTFTKKDHASRHSKIHTAERAVACIYPSCKKLFARMDNMKQHLDTHYKKI
jgi:hypothetical protein